MTYASDTTLVKNLQGAYPDFQYDESLQDELIRNVKAGADPTELIVRNLVLICKLVDKYYYGPDKEDAVMLGIQTLLRCVQLYDPKKNIRFSTYVGSAILFAMQRKELEDNSGPTHSAGMTVPIGRYRQNAEKYNAMTDKEVARDLGIAPDMVPFIRELGGNTLLSMDQSVSDSEDDYSPLSDFVSDPTTEMEVQKFMYREDLARAFEETEALSDMERDILVARYGLDGYPERTLREVSEKYHISRERIRQYEIRAIRKIRKKCGRWDYFPKRYSYA